MLLPLSWLKEYVDIKMPFAKLAQLMSGVGLTVETWREEDGDIIFDPEVTPNRPDWLSVYGVAREIAAITNEKLKKKNKQSFSTNEKLQLKIKKSLDIKIVPNYKIVPRITSVIIKNVTVKPSPTWLTKRITQIGLRPINNLVDITNYVLWLYGGLLHVFDYDQIHGRVMTVTQAAGGEAFRSLDGLDYKLPKGAIIIKDKDRIIDLLPLKGGENTASTHQTKNVLLHSVVVDPVLTRRTSQALGLRSDSSAVAERGLDPNSTLVAVKTALQLILECAGGEIASEIIDHKEKEFKPWIVKMSHARLENVLGIKIEQKRVMEIFRRLGLAVTGLNPARSYSDDVIYKVTVPTFRNDLQIEEDLIEEVGRIYGYNNFPKTLPATAIPMAQVAYAKNYDLEYEVKQILAGFGFSEIYTYSLISEEQLTKLGIDPQKTLRVDNPISRDFEYLRHNLFGNLLDSYKLNQENFADIKIYELGKRYLGETIDKVKEEYWLWGALSGQKFPEAKGSLELLFKKLGIDFNFRRVTKEDRHDWFSQEMTIQIEDQKGNYLGVLGVVDQALLSKWEIKSKVTCFGLNYDLLEKLVKKKMIYQPPAKYPAVVEDLALIIKEGIEVGKIMQAIYEVDRLIADVSLFDSYETTKTFRLTYQSQSKTLTNEEVGKIREKVLKLLKIKFNATLKEF